MTEFDKFWERQDQTLDRAFAERVWHSAQRAALRVVFNKPPYIPEVGDKVKILTLCHPNILGQVRLVTEVIKEPQDIYWITTTEGQVFSQGVLGEVEKVEHDA